MVPDTHRWGINDDLQATGNLPEPHGDPDAALPPDDLLVRARQAGFGWVRYVLFWHAVNPAPGVYEWFVPDVEIARLHAAGFNILVQVAYPPTWTTGATYPNEHAPFWCLDESDPDGVLPGGPNTEIYFNCRDPQRRPGYRPPGQELADRSQDFREFVRAAIDRYRDRCRAWGFGVEFHNKVFWKGTPQQLLDEMLRPGYEEAKRIDSGLLVVGPDEDIEDYFEVMLKLEAEGLAAGRGAALDVLAFHAFDHSGWKDPAQLETEWRGGSRGIDCTFETSQADRLCSLKGIVDRYRRGRPLWLTEVGYRTSASLDPGAADRQRAWLTAWIDGIKARPWIDKTFLYRLLQRTDAPSGDFGLFFDDEARTPVPALSAVVDALANQPLPLISYLAEGATGGFFDLDVAVANPSPTPAPVKVSFLKPDGRIELLTEELKPTSRKTYRVEGLPGLPSLASTAVSTVVESTIGLPLVVERTMFWDADYYGGHGGSAVSRPERTWYFAEGSQGFFDTFVLLANPGVRAANVTVTFLLEGGDPVVHPVTVPATSRVNVWAVEPGNGALIGRSFAIRVEADVPIIAERAMYFGTAPGNRQWNGGHESAGVPAPATSWFLAEGATVDPFTEWILIGNPGDAEADVTFTFLLSTGETVTGTKRVPAQSRFSLNVADAGAMLDHITAGDAALLRRAELSTTVDASVPIVAERAMYWPGNFTTWAEAHNSFGVTETATQWGLAEGRVGGPRQYATFILLANPNDAPARVQLKYLRKPGSPPVVREIVVAGHSRLNEWANAVPELADEEFGVLIVSDLPIAVERAMYWNAPGAPFFAGGTNATAVRIP
jgi:hypothetical protein